MNNPTDELVTWEPRECRVISEELTGTAITLGMVLPEGVSPPLGLCNPIRRSSGCFDVQLQHAWFLLDELLRDKVRLTADHILLSARRKTLRLLSQTVQKEKGTLETRLKTEQGMRDTLTRQVKTLTQLLAAGSRTISDLPPSTPSNRS